MLLFIYVIYNIIYCFVEKNKRKEKNKLGHISRFVTVICFIFLCYNFSLFSFFLFFNELKKKRSQNCFILVSLCDWQVIISLWEIIHEMVLADKFSLNYSERLIANKIKMKWKLIEFLFWLFHLFVNWWTENDDGEWNERRLKRNDDGEMK